MQNLATLLILIGIGIIIYLLKYSLPAYFSRKAENLAQKEDLKVLTEIPERVRAEFGKASLVHRVQFESEFRHYERLWKYSHIAFKAHVRLYPVAGEPIPKPTQKEFDAFIKAQLDFADALDDSKPFMPAEVWKVFYDFEDELIDAKVQGLTGKQTADVRHYRDKVRKLFDKCAAQIAARLENLLVVET